MQDKHERKLQVEAVLKQTANDAQLSMKLSEAIAVMRDAVRTVERNVNTIQTPETVKRACQKARKSLYGVEQHYVAAYVNGSRVNTNVVDERQSDDLSEQDEFSVYNATTLAHMELINLAHTLRQEVRAVEYEISIHNTTSVVMISCIKAIKTLSELERLHKAAFYKGYISLLEPLDFMPEDAC